MIWGLPPHPFPSRFFIFISDRRGTTRKYVSLRAIAELVFALEHTDY